MIETGYYWFYADQEVFRTLYGEVRGWFIVLVYEAAHYRLRCKWDDHCVPIEDLKGRYVRIEGPPE
jgi:hypothetical protein